MNDRFDIGSLAADAVEWHSAAMPDETQDEVLLKLEEEAHELYLFQDSSEAADVLLTLLIWLGRAGYSPSQLLQAAHDKLQINHLRRWKRMPNGTYHHV